MRIARICLWRKFFTVEGADAIRCVRGEWECPTPSLERHNFVHLAPKGSDNSRVSGYKNRFTLVFARDAAKLVIKAVSTRLDTLAAGESERAELTEPPVVEILVMLMVMVVKPL